MFVFAVVFCACAKVPTETKSSGDYFRFVFVYYFETIGSGWTYVATLASVVVGFTFPLTFAVGIGWGRFDLLKVRKFARLAAFLLGLRSARCVGGGLTWRAWKDRGGGIVEGLYDTVRIYLKFY